MKDTAGKPLGIADRIQCMDTKEHGHVIASRNGLPVVKFDDGAVGVCTACRRVTK